MTFDWKERRFAIGPYVRVGVITLLRLWRWDYVSIGNLRRVVRHEEME